MHVVCKETSTTTKLWAVFDASAHSSTGVSLNEYVVDWAHSAFLSYDVLLRFHMHRVVITADVSRMYRAVLLDPLDRDLHRFVWRPTPLHPLCDYHMTHLTFGVAASSYAANMCIKQNTQDFFHQFPMAAKAVDSSFYVDDALTGADSVDEAITLQQQLQELSKHAGFTLRKWNSSNPPVLQHIPDELKNTQVQCILPDDYEYTKTLGVKWNTIVGHFRLTISVSPRMNNGTKRALISDVGKVFDVFRWFAPYTVKMKILFQKLWTIRIGWDDSVLEDLLKPWLCWRTDLHLLSTKTIPCCMFNKTAQVSSMELHSFSDASELAYLSSIFALRPLMWCPNIFHIL